MSSPHDRVLILALFTLAISAVSRGFISISDWLHNYQEDLKSDILFYQKPITFLQHHPSGVVEIELQSI